MIKLTDLFDHQLEQPGDLAAALAACVVVNPGASQW